MKAELQADRKMFWGWFIVIGGFIILGINYGARYCFGVFLKPMCEELGWSRSVVSFAMSLYLMFYGLGGVIGGRLLDRFAPRWIIIGGSAIAAMALVLTPFIATPLQLFLVYGVMYGTGASFFGNTVCASYAGKWFLKKRGVAIGTMTIGIGAGTMLLTPLAGVVVQYFNWRMGLILLGAAIFVVCTVLSQLFMGRTRPEDYGLLPDGAATLTRHPERPADAQKPSYWMTARFLLKDSRFWIINISFALITMTQMSVFVHHVPYAEELGINRIAAASSLGLIAFVSIAGRFFYGWLSDRLSDPKYAACLGSACMSFAMLILLFFHSIDFFYLYVCLFGFGYGCITPMLTILTVDRFGRDISGTALGLISFFVASIGASLGPIFGGIIYDITGSYTIAWQISLVILLSVTVLILFLKPAGNPEIIQR